MKRPFKVPAIVLGALAALFMGFGSAAVGTGVANANPGWDPGWHGNSWDNQWNNGWPGNGCNNGCGPNWGNNQMVWKDGPAGRSPVLVNWRDQWKQWCWDPWINDYVLR